MRHVRQHRWTVRSSGEACGEACGEARGEAASSGELLPLPLPPDHPILGVRDEPHKAATCSRCNGEPSHREAAVLETYRLEYTAATSRRLLLRTRAFSSATSTSFARSRLAACLRLLKTAARPAFAFARVISAAALLARALAKY